MDTRPNILLILTDQHRLSAVGCYGETPCRTPNIDRLAREGVRFDTCYTTCPVCSPARASILTGLYPHQHGITANVGDLGCSVHALQDHSSLLSRRLGSKNYRCGYSGKWHLCTDDGSAFGQRHAPSLPRDLGFEGQSLPGHGGGGFYYPEYRNYLSELGVRHEVHLPPGRPAPARTAGILKGPLESTVPYYLTGNTIDLIDRFAGGDQPFFIWHNFWGPHQPYYATRDYFDLYRDADIPPWPTAAWDAAGTPGPHRTKLHPSAATLSWENWAEAIRYYYAFTTMIDDQIGRMLTHLDETGLADNTIVIFCADHGETLGSHGGLYDKGWHHFEEIQRIPLIVRGSGIEAGRAFPHRASLADLYPTILDLADAGEGAPRGPGRSLAPLMRGEELSWDSQSVVEFFGVNNLATTMVTLRRGELKYGWNAGGDDELYDLGTDPDETTNLIADPGRQGALREMRERLLAWFEQTDFPAEGREMYRRTRMTSTPVTF